MAIITLSIDMVTQCLSLEICLSTVSDNTLTSKISYKTTLLIGTLRHNNSIFMMKPVTENMGNL